MNLIYYYINYFSEQTEVVWSDNVKGCTTYSMRFYRKTFKFI